MKYSLPLSFPLILFTLLAGCKSTPPAQSSTAVSPPVPGQTIPADSAAVNSAAASLPVVINAQNASHLAPLMQLGTGRFSYDIELSPDGKTLAVSSSAGVLLYDSASGELARLIQTAGSIGRLAFSPDGQSIAAIYDRPSGGVYASDTGFDGLPKSVTVLALWDSASGEQRFERSLKDAGCGNTHSRRLVFSRGGEWIASDDWFSLYDQPRQRNVCFLSARDGRTLRVINVLQDAPDGVEGSLALSPDGATLAVGAGKAIILYRTADGSLLRRIPNPATSEVLAFSPDGTRLLSAGYAKDDEQAQHTATIWSLIDGSLLQTLTGGADSILSLAWSPDGRWISVGSSDGWIVVWDAQNGSLLRKIEPVQVEYPLEGQLPIPVWDLTFSPAGETLFALGNAFTVQVPSEVRAWRVSDGQEVRRITDAVETRLGFSPDGKHLVAGGMAEGKAQVWNVSDGTLVLELKGHSGMVNQSLFSPDGSLIATASNDATLRLWNSANGTPLHVLKGHTAKVTHTAFSPDGNLLASGAEDHTLRIWKTADGSLVNSRVMGEGKWTIAALAFTPDGSRLLYGLNLYDTIGGYRGQWALWDWKNNDVRAVSNTFVLDAFYVPDGNTYAAWSGEHGGIQVGRLVNDDLVPLQALRSPKGNGGLDGVALSPDGRLLVSGNGFGLHVWDFTAQQLVTIVAEKGGAYPYGYFAFSPDGQHIAISGSPVSIWGIQP